MYFSALPETPGKGPGLPHSLYPVSQHHPRRSGVRTTSWRRRCGLAVCCGTGHSGSAGEEGLSDTRELRHTAGRPRSRGPISGRAKEDHGHQRIGSASCRLKGSSLNYFSRSPINHLRKSHCHLMLFGAKTLKCDEEGQVAQVRGRTVLFRNESQA